MFTCCTVIWEKCHFNPHMAYFRTYGRIDKKQYFDIDFDFDSARRGFTLGTYCLFFLNISKHFFFFSRCIMKKNLTPLEFFFPHGWSYPSLAPPLMAHGKTVFLSKIMSKWPFRFFIQMLGACFAVQLPWGATKTHYILTLTFNIWTVSGYFPYWCSCFFNLHCGNFKALANTISQWFFSPMTSMFSLIFFTHLCMKWEAFFHLTTSEFLL